LSHTNDNFSNHQQQQENRYPLRSSVTFAVNQTKEEFDDNNLFRKMHSMKFQSNSNIEFAYIKKMSGDKEEWIDG
jgi:hypothetical protein